MKKTFWQRLNSAHWGIQMLLGIIIGTTSSALLVTAGINETIAWIAGFVGINLIVFFVIGYLAHEDDLK